MHVRLAASWIVITGLLLTSCANLFDEDTGNVSENEIPFERRGVIPLRSGFVEGKAVEYYNLGLFVPSETVWFPRYDKFPGMHVREMYVWPDAAGAPMLEGSQLPVVDTLPAQAQSSDFFELVMVRPGAGTRPNDIKSRATLLRSGFTLEPTGRVVNCPLVGDNAALAGAPASRYRRLVLWYRKKAVHCFLFEGGGGVPALKVFASPVGAGRTELRVAAGDVYTLRSTAYAGADEVRGIAVPQNDIFRQPPSSPDYTPLVKLWEVTVVSDYVVGKFRSYADLFPIPGFTPPGIAARVPETFCNCPLVSAGFRTPSTK